MAEFTIDKAKLPKDWPTHNGSTEFWKELGRTVATFGFLENFMRRALFATVWSRRCNFSSVEEAKAKVRETEEKSRRSLTASFHRLIEELAQELQGDPRFPQEESAEIVRQLKDIKLYRNVICHAAWVNFDSNCSAHPVYCQRAGNEVEAFDGPMSVKEMADIRDVAADIASWLALVERTVRYQFPSMPDPMPEV